MTTQQAAFMLSYNLTTRIRPQVEKLGTTIGNSDDLFACFRAAEAQLAALQTSVDQIYLVAERRNTIPK